MENSQEPATDRRHHVRSLLMRESLLDKQVMSSTETPVVRMLPDCHVIKVGGRSIIDGGKASAYPLVEAIGAALAEHKLIIGTGGGVRSRHVFSIGIDLGLPTGVLAQLAHRRRAGQRAHARHAAGAVWRRRASRRKSSATCCRSSCRPRPASSSTAIRPTPCGSIRPRVGRIPPHRSDAGAYLLAECFGCATITLIKDVDGLYDRDPKEHPNARFIDEISVSELRERNLPTLPFDRALLDLLEHARLVTRFQIINGREPELLAGALRGERVGTIVRKDDAV